MSATRTWVSPGGQLEYVELPTKRLPTDMELSRLRGKRIVVNHEGPIPALDLKFTGTVARVEVRDGVVRLHCHQLPDNWGEQKPTVMPSLEDDTEHLDGTKRGL